MPGKLNEVEVQGILKDSHTGRIGCTDGIKFYMLPVNYLYENNSILCYSPENLKIKMMRKHPNVVFEVDRIGRSVNWKFVVVNGTFEEITDPKELKEVKLRYMEHMLRKKVSLTVFSDNETKVTAQKPSHKYVFYRIHINKGNRRDS